MPLPKIPDGLKKFLSMLPPPVVAVITYVIEARLEPLEYWKHLAIWLLVFPPALGGAAIAHFAPSPTSSQTTRVFAIVGAVVALILTGLFYEWYTGEPPRDAIFGFYVFFAGCQYALVYGIFGYALMLIFLTILKFYDGKPVSATTNPPPAVDANSPASDGPDKK